MQDTFNQLTFSQTVTTCIALRRAVERYNQLAEGSPYADFWIEEARKVQEIINLLEVVNY
jgi:hypothetical protein